MDHLTFLIGCYYLVSKMLVECLVACKSVLFTTIAAVPVTHGTPAKAKAQHTPHPIQAWLNTKHSSEI